MNKSSSSGLIDAKFEEHQLCRSKQCPGCGHKLEAKPDWVGLPAGVKFDPTDQELIEHLEAKAQAKDGKSHPLIDEFIPTIEGEDGICYTHPEKLPGVTRDGLSRHFFHRPSKAYTTGTRKRRKIQNESCDVQGTGETRWHKTGKTRPVLVNGRQIGCKKILVLYTNFGKNRKPEKTNWVMHQYHLGQNEEEKEGELVVSKIFYQTQPRQCNWSTDHRSVNTGEGSSTDHNISRRDSTGSGSCSSKEISINNPHGIREEVSAASVTAMVPNYENLDISGLKSDHHLAFLPFSNSFDEMGVLEASRARAGPMPGTCEDRVDQRSSHYVADDHHHHQHHHLHHPDHHQEQLQIASSIAFHTSRPSLPSSTIISPSHLHQHAPIVLDENSYHFPRIMLQNEGFLQQNHHHRHELEGRSGSGLEDLIMSCTSNYIKEESSIPNTQEAEWVKFSTFWPEPDTQDRHG